MKWKKQENAVVVAYVLCVIAVYAFAQKNSKKCSRPKQENSCLKHSNKKVTQMIGTELKSTINAIGLAFESRKRLVIGIISTIAMAFLSIYIPATITPGNTIEFQISLLTRDNVLLAPVNLVG